MAEHDVLVCVWAEALKEALELGGDRIGEWNGPA
jgi:hypothetical protein